MGNSQLLTQEHLARAYQWSLFPAPIQERLYQHYLTHIHQGDLRMAASDIQSASNTLEWLVLGARIDGCLNEHYRYFGEASTADLVDMVQQLRELQTSPTTDQRPS
jgi:hypothetical protein